MEEEGEEGEEGDGGGAWVEGRKVDGEGNAPKVPTVAEGDT